MLDQQSIVIEEFKGLFDRGELADTNVIQIKSGYFKTLNNYYHQGDSLVMRPGTQATGKFADSTMKTRLWPYGNNSFLTLYDTGGATYDIQDSAFAATPLQAVTLANSYQLYILKDKAYGGEIQFNSSFSQPLGLGNLKLYKFDGNPFRDAAGASPSAGAPMAAATSATAGVVEAGVHIIAVAYETDTGFITPPGVFVGGIYTPAQYTAPGAFSIDLTAIPVGPAGTVARHILASKVVRPPFNGDVTVPELFFVPGGKIANNVATTLTINFYDTALVNSADYLLDELEIVPAGTCYCIYKNRLIIVGFPPGAGPTVAGVTTSAPYVARISAPGLYESFSSTEGFSEIFPNDGTGLQACWEQNGNLYFAKSNRTYVTRDNGGPPNTWDVTLVDATIGCGPWGIAKVDDSQNTLIEGGSIINGDRGIYYFNGVYGTYPLTYNIDALYKRHVSTQIGLNPTVAYNKLYYDSFRRLLFWLPISLFVDGLTSVFGSTFILVGACDNGLSPENIRWSKFYKFGERDEVTSSFIPTTERVITDIYTTRVQNAGNDRLINMTFTTAPDDVTMLAPFLGVDDQTTAFESQIFWEVVSFPPAVEDLSKLQVVKVAALIKHNNSLDPCNFNLGAYNFSYDEFTPTTEITFGDQENPDLVLLPQLYDAPVNLRSSLVGIALSRGDRGGNVQNSLRSNATFIQRLIISGNQAQQDKLRGSIK